MKFGNLLDMAKKAKGMIKPEMVDKVAAKAKSINPATVDKVAGKAGKLVGQERAAKLAEKTKGMLSDEKIDNMAGKARGFVADKQGPPDAGPTGRTGNDDPPTAA